MKNILTLKTKYMIEKGIFGLIWLCMGILQFMKLQESFRIIVVVAIFTYLSINCILYFVKAEQEDEIAVYNNNRARLYIYDKLVRVIISCIIIASIKDKWMIDLKLILPFILGGMNILEFILFVFYEKVGDKYGETKNKNS